MEDKHLSGNVQEGDYRVTRLPKISQYTYMNKSKVTEQDYIDFLIGNDSTSDTFYSRKTAPVTRH